MKRLANGLRVIVMVVTLASTKKPDIAYRSRG